MNCNLFTFALSGYLLAVIFYLGYSVFKRNSLGLTADVFLALSFIFHTIIIAARWYTAKQPPLVTLYESLLFYSWAVVSFYLIFTFFYKMRYAGFWISLLATLVFGITSLLNKDIQPLIPALKSNWLFIHVSTYFIGYGGVTISFILSFIYLVNFKKEVPFLDDLAFRFIAFSFPFLTIGLTTGSVWANVAWGSWWSWDPKETWSLVTWFVYALYLHLRFFRGWKGRKSAYLNLLGFLCTLFTFLGVNYLLQGLHSYM